MGPFEPLDRPLTTMARTNQPDWAQVSSSRALSPCWTTLLYSTLPCPCRTTGRWHHPRGTLMDLTAPDTSTQIKATLTGRNTTAVTFSAS